MSSKKDINLIPEEEYVPQTIPRVMSAWLTSYEYAALITARASQLMNVENPYVDPKEYDYNFIEIAKAEIDQKLPSLVVGRRLNDGSCEYWKLKELFFPTP